MPEDTRAIQNIADDLVRLSFAEWLHNEEAARQDKIAMFRRYYAGEHDTQLTARQAAFLELDPETEFNLNYCPIPVDELAERLRVIGFNAGAEQSPILWDWWQASFLDRQQKILYTSAAKDSVSYILVEFDEDNNRPKFSYESACVGSEGVKVHFSPEDRMTPMLASKRWIVELGPDAGKKRRLNLYYPDRIEKYISDSESQDGNWVKLPDESGAWPIWWTDNALETGEPLGVPVFAFINNDQGNGRGVSELENAISIQNAVNKSVIDLLAAADTNGFPMVKFEGEDPGEQEIGPGAIVYTTGDGKIGALPGADLTSMSDTVDSFVIHMARVTRTPLTAFQLGGGGQAKVSGETLKELDKGLVSKAEDRQVSFGATWVQAMAMARKLNNVFAKGKEAENLTEEQEIASIWEPAQTEDEETRNKAVAEKRKLNLPLDVLWKELGYTEQEVEDMKKTPEYAAYLAGLELMQSDSEDMDDADAA